MTSFLKGCYPLWLGGVRRFSTNESGVICWCASLWSTYMFPAPFWFIGILFDLSVQMSAYELHKGMQEARHLHTNEPPRLVLFPFSRFWCFYLSEGFCSVSAADMYCILSLWVMMFLSKQCLCLGEKHAERMFAGSLLMSVAKINVDKL